MHDVAWPCDYVRSKDAHKQRRRTSLRGITMGTMAYMGEYPSYALLYPSKPLRLVATGKNMAVGYGVTCDQAEF